MKHLELKKQLLTEEEKSHKIQLFNKTHKLETIGFKELQETGQTDKLQLVDQLHSNYTPEELEACYQLNDARKKRYLRLKNYIMAMSLFFDNLYFVTLTFSPEFYDSKDETKRDHVKRCLHKNSPYYIANVDYGAQFGRLHYHCITTEFIKPDMWPYGAVYTEKIKNSSKDIAKVSKYAVKMTNHALKETNKTKKVLYSRALTSLICIEQAFFGVLPLLAWQFN